MIYFLLFLQQLISSGTHIVAKTLTSEVAPAVVLLYRASLASFLFLFPLFFQRKTFLKVTKKDWMLFALLGLLNIPINQLIFLISMQMTTAPNVSFAYSLVPAFVLILSIAFYKEKTTKLKIIGIVIAVIGTILLLMNKGFDLNSVSSTGDLLALLASFSWALYTLIGKPLVLKYGAIFTTGVAMISGLLLYLPVFHYLPVEYSFSDISAKNWWQIFYIGAITSFVGYSLWYYALQKLEASKVAVFNNMQPIMTVILAYFVLDNVINTNFVVAGLLIITGVVITQRG